nr:sulfhydryl oxidase 2-like isoform X1 [Ipomoea batatas]
MASPTLLLLFTATLLLSSYGYGYGASESVSSAVDLTAVDFDAVLRDTPATHAIVQFYAHWCPACRNYKPHYEKVARLFNGVDAIHPGILLLTRIDCALKVLCKSLPHDFMGTYGFDDEKKEESVLLTKVPNLGQVRASANNHSDEPPSPANDKTGMFNPLSFAFYCYAEISAQRRKEWAPANLLILRGAQPLRRF